MQRLMQRTAFKQYDSRVENGLSLSSINSFHASAISWSRATFALLTVNLCDKSDTNEESGEHVLHARSQFIDNTRCKKWLRNSSETSTFMVTMLFNVIKHECRMPRAFLSVPQ
mmetsp:Transcript_42813/g.91014  ORF Transcript_42813/g.91014 Transcript_42813/m.91014 type:complete len:113 (+) Transcript_42813:473-811(+)